MAMIKHNLNEVIDRLEGRRIIASISGGKDSAAMSLYLSELGLEHERVFMDTGFESPLLYEYLRGPLTAKLGPITEIRAEMDFFALVRHKGMFPSRVTRFCTVELKVLPIQRYIAGLQDSGDVVNAVGIRRAESKARSEMKEWEWSEGFDCETWRPLVTWTRQDVEDIHWRNGLGLNPLYLLGAGRVGCFPCIHASKKEISLVARIDPGRIAQIRDLERELCAKGAARDEELDREFRPRTMYNYHGHRSKKIPISIDEAVDWSNSSRGEWQPPGAGDGCMRFGVCELMEETDEGVERTDEGEP
jgi:3'-phosphoadenosine 5'-phosphosulfate sulfotransferase (PAPS reductase)/FAD synthetase